MFDSCSKAAKRSWKDLRKGDPLLQQRRRNSTSQYSINFSMSSIPAPRKIPCSISHSSASSRSPLSFLWKKSIVPNTLNSSFEIFSSIMLRKNISDVKFLYRLFLKSVLSVEIPDIDRSLQSFFIFHLMSLWGSIHARIDA